MGARNVRSSAYAAVFSMPQRFSICLIVSAINMLNTQGDIILPCGVPLFVFII